MSERRNVQGYIKGLLDQRDELNQEIQAKIAERQELVLKEKLEVVSLAPQTDLRANRGCARVSEFERDRLRGLAPPNEQILMDNL